MVPPSQARIPSTPTPTSPGMVKNGEIPRNWGVPSNTAGNGIRWPNFCRVRVTAPPRRVSCVPIHSCGRIILCVWSCEMVPNHLVPVDLKHQFFLHDLCVLCFVYLSFSSQVLPQEPSRSKLTRTRKNVTLKQCRTNQLVYTRYLPSRLQVSNQTFS